MVSYNYLGYGVTDENGIAKLEYNSEGQKRDHSYTGVGAGEIDVLASLDNPIGSGSIVSETLSVLDCIFLDIATSTETKNTDWTNISSYCTIGTPSDEGTTVSASTQGTTGRYISNATLTGDFLVEFSVKFNGQNSKFGFRDGSSDVYTTSQNSTTERYWQIRRINGVLQQRHSTDGETWSDWGDNETHTNDLKFGFMLPVSSSAERALTYRNLKIYPI